MSSLGDEKDADRIKILVVEDEFFIADDLQQILTSAGFLVLGPAATNEHTLDLIEEDRPDVAVLDVNLHGTIVTPVALELQRLEIPFVLASAHTADDLRYNPVLSDAINLGKPTEPSFLLEAVRKMLK
ncbi:response regulator [Rhizobium grahamii]|uniref:Response regulatory domain-containing protein n=1 Tax=Rhizobium grahamii CCGE 502 TaxID=990285 RepID=S3HIS0_9HYPH|nr:response regulator [Rhizobium grahamii]EPE98637.1 hypothetical protein RGCCGE502_09430 [Rhizobium grahamii CCGE 502]